MAEIHTHECQGILPVENAEYLLAQLLMNCGMNTRERHGEFFERLKRIVSAFAKALQETDESVSFREAANFSLMARMHRRPSTRADLRSYIDRMCRYPEFADSALRRISISQCRQMLAHCFGHSPHSYRKAQAVLHSVFNQGMRQGWCSSNPAKAILRPPVQEKKIHTLTLTQIQALLLAVKRTPSLHCMEASLRLMLWCGIRPTEVRRLRWSDVDPDEELVYVEPENSKTGGARAIPLRGGALLILQLETCTDELIASTNWSRLWHLLRLRAGFDTWQNDVLRHTFASMHLKRFHNLSLLQEEMGHRNSHLLQTRYLNLRHLKKSTARRFFQADAWK